MEKEFDIKVLDQLEEKLQLLTGFDFEEAEKTERLTGNTATVISTSPGFIIRIAAMALECTPQDLKGLPITKYATVLSRTSSFLFAPSATEILLKKSENLQ